VTQNQPVWTLTEAVNVSQNQPVRTLTEAEPASLDVD